MYSSKGTNGFASQSVLKKYSCTLTTEGPNKTKKERGKQSKNIMKRQINND